MIRGFFYKFSWAVWLYHFALAVFGVLLYRFPSRHITVIGVTGTKGKSTVVEILAFILLRAGKKVAVSSSIRNMESGLTMPGRFFIQRLLRRAVNEGCDYAIIEVTSQGVMQSRHRFIKWSVAAFTNIQPEHIEAHGSFEKYRKAKVSFFEYVRHNPKSLFVINKDDENAQYFITAANLLKSDFNRLVLYGKSNLLSQLTGEFNKYNIGAAVAIAESLGIEGRVIQKAIVEFPGAYGRMEYVQKELFAVVVDYAVTPDSLRNVYETLRPHAKKLICVFGCTGGGRDVWKRPVMGEIAAEYCDEIILTDDDSYDEPVETIMNEIEKGILKAHFKIADRKEAIQKALLLARPGDVVVVTGKGGDQWLRGSHGKKLPWSDQNIAKDTLKSLILLLFIAIDFFIESSI